MIAAGNVYNSQNATQEEINGMRVENEQLKAMIEIMKVEMEQVLKTVSK